jgi:serine/threonine-protein kinase
VGLPPGKILDNRYRIESLIKAGGMGAVYRAEDTQLHKIIAIKEMLDSFENAVERQAGIDRFLSEVQVMETLAHPNIPRVTDHFVQNNNFYFVMELVEGTDLSKKLHKEGTPGLPPLQVLEWGAQVCSALDYLHGLRPPIVHRDLKPSNILLNASDGRILLIDFGIARATNPSGGYWIGTAGYAPPEQQAGKHEPRSDLYALGALMHELISGQKPREDFTFKSLDDYKRSEPLPAGTWAAISKALGLFPNERYQNARQMREALLGVLGYEPAVQQSPGFAFRAAVARLKEASIDPLLGQLVTRYGNECQTRSWPRQLERMVFTLGIETPFELVIQVNEDRGQVDFIERQGILDPQLLGSVPPEAEDAHQLTSACVDRFIKDYESFKNASWQLSF